MLTTLAKLPAGWLTRAAALILSGVMAGCGGGGDGWHEPLRPPRDEGVTYDVIPLSLGGKGTEAVVHHNGITADGKVAGTIDARDGSLHAFLYDGARMIDLGTMGGNGSEAHAINQRGQVVGRAFGPGWSRAFLYDGTMHDLGNFGGTEALAADINEGGQVTGYATSADGARHAFVYRDGQLRQLATPGGASVGWVINGAGQVAGDFHSDARVQLGFFDETCGCIRPIGTLGGAESLVIGMNDAGHVIGVSDTAGGQRHAFLYRDGAMTDLGTLGGAGSFAAAVNEAGLVAGDADTASGDARAFLYDGKSLRDLGTFGGVQSRADSVNGAGQVVGFARTSRGEPRAFRWTEADGMVDLNTRIPDAPRNLVLSGAGAVSDSGNIVAYSNFGLVLLRVRNGSK
jgi:probable HAF family extracellular repeat protein